MRNHTTPRAHAFPRDMWHTVTAPGSRVEIALAKVGTFMAIVVLCYTTMPAQEQVWGIALAGALAWISSQSVSAVAKEATQRGNTVVLKQNLPWVMLVTFAMVATVAYITGEPWFGVWGVWAVLAAAAIVGTSPVKVATLCLSAGVAVATLHHFAMPIAALIVSITTIAWLVSWTGLMNTTTPPPGRNRPDVDVLWVAVPAALRAIAHIALIMLVVVSVEPSIRLAVLVAGLLTVAAAEPLTELVVATMQMVTRRTSSWGTCQDTTMILTTLLLVVLLSIATGTMLSFGPTLYLSTACLAVTALTVFTNAIVVSGVLARTGRVKQGIAVLWIYGALFAPYPLWSYFAVDYSLYALAAYFLAASITAWVVISRQLMQPALWLEHEPNDLDEPLLAVV